MTQVIRHVVFRGRVQGVGFRACVEDMAARPGVAGWVRNRRDGTVEAVFAGDAKAVEATIAACRKGPDGARVDGVRARRPRRRAGAARRRDCSRCCRPSELAMPSASGRRPEQRLELAPQHHVDLGHASTGRPRSARLVTP